MVNSIRCSDDGISVEAPGSLVLARWVTAFVRVILGSENRRIIELFKSPN